MRGRRSVAPVAVAALSLAVHGCAADSNDPNALPRAKAAAARDGILARADQDRRRGTWPTFTKGAGQVAANACFPSGKHGERVYCEVAFDHFFYDSDKYCVTGYSADREGGQVRHERVGDPRGPGFECGKLSKDGDPLPSS